MHVGHGARNCPWDGVPRSLQCQQGGRRGLGTLPAHSLCSTRYFWRRHPQLRLVELNFISLFWPSLPDGIQAAYEDVDEDLVFLFKGNYLQFSPCFRCPRSEGRISLWSLPG